MDELISVAEEESLTEESQSLKVDTYDVFFDKDVFEGAKEKLGRCLEELPSEKGGWGTMEGLAGMQLADGVCGVIDDGRGGASVSARHGDPVKTAQDVLFIPTVHAYTVFPSTTTSYTRPAAISTPNTLSTLPMEDVLPPRVNAGNARSYAREYDGTACWNWLG